MATNFEFVRSHALPRALVLRVATARAIDALVMYQATHTLSAEQRNLLEQASRVLRPTSAEEPLRAGRSIADYRKDMGLIRAAKRVWGSPKASALTTRLKDAADKLSDLADGTELLPQDVADLTRTLRAFRDAIAPAGPTLTERVGRSRP